MRRRLTVTGASETIDGVSKMTVSEPEVEVPDGTKVRLDSQKYNVLARWEILNLRCFTYILVRSCHSLRCYRIFRYLEEGSCSLQP
jgi:hypothetical protein